MAKFSFVVGVLTMSFSLLIYELSPLWLSLDVVGFVCALTAWRRGDPDGKSSMWLCGIAGLFSLTGVVFLLMSVR